MRRSVVLKKFFLVFLSIFFVIINTINAAEQRIAIVDWSEVTMNYIWFQQQFIKLNEKQTAIKEMAGRESNEIKNLENELKDLTDRAELASKKAELSKRKLELDDFLKQANDLLKKREEQLLVEAKKKILEAIKFVAIQNNYTIVLSKEQVLYAADAASVNITDRVLRKLNEEQKK